MLLKKMRSSRVARVTRLCCRKSLVYSYRVLAQSKNLCGSPVKVFLEPERLNYELESEALPIECIMLER